MQLFIIRSANSLQLSNISPLVYGQAVYVTTNLFKRNNKNKLASVSYISIVRVMFRPCLIVKVGTDYYPVSL